MYANASWISVRTVSHSAKSAGARQTAISIGFIKWPFSPTADDVTLRGEERIFAASRTTRPAVHPWRRRFRAAKLVMPGLEPGIHVLAAARKTWMAGSSPAMTKKRIIFTLLGKASGSQDEAGSGRTLFSPHLARDIDSELQLGPLLFLGEDVALFG